MAPALIVGGTASYTLTTTFTGTGSAAGITAMALATPRGLDVDADEEWEELDFGDWDGQSLFDLPEDALAAFTFRIA